MSGKKKPSNITKSIGLRIKKIRQKNYKTGVECAKVLGVSPSQLSDWENGYTGFSAEQMTSIADALKVDPGWLFTGKKQAPATSAGAQAQSIHPDLAVEYANVLAHSASVLGFVVDGSIPTEAVEAAIGIYKTTTQQLLEIRQQESGEDMQSIG